jgi:hypothetical protein
VRFAIFCSVPARLGQPPRLRLSKERGYLFDGAATPPCKGGEYFTLR